MDHSTYISFPNLAAERLVVMAKALCNRAQQLDQHLTPSEILTGVIAAMLASTQSLADVLASQPEANLDRVAIDRVLDDAWRAFFFFLLAHRERPDAEVSALAQRGVDHFFPDESLAFTKLTFKLEWEASRQRLESLEPALEEELNTLGAAPFLADVRAAFAEYTQMLGLEGEVAIAEKVDLQSAIKNLRHDIESYVFTLLPYGFDESLEPVVLQALAPIVEARKGL